MCIGVCQSKKSNELMMGHLPKDVLQTFGNLQLVYSSGQTEIMMVSRGR